MTKLLDILEVIVPYKHFHKLRQFVDVKLPPGFPVKLSKHTNTTCAIYRVYVHILHAYCMYLWMYQCTYVCMYVRMFVRMYCVCMYCICISVSILHTYCMYLWMYLCMYVCRYVCVYCVCISVDTYTYMYVFAVHIYCTYVWQRVVQMWMCCWKLQLEFVHQCQPYLEGGGMWGIAST